MLLSSSVLSNTLAAAHWLPLSRMHCFIDIRGQGSIASCFVQSSSKNLLSTKMVLFCCAFFFSCKYYWYNTDCRREKQTDLHFDSKSFLSWRSELGMVEENVENWNEFENSVLKLCSDEKNALETFLFTIVVNSTSSLFSC